MKTRYRLLLICLITAGGNAQGVEALNSPESPERYNVTWDSPSQDQNGSMPLGNGSTGLNAWIEPDGDLVFYISRTDSWGDNGRLRHRPGSILASMFTIPCLPLMSRTFCRFFCEKIYIGFKKPRSRCSLANGSWAGKEVFSLVFSFFIKIK